MLRTLLRMKEPFYIARQEQAPLLRERELFLEHLLRQGTSLAAARSVSWQLVNVIRLLRLTALRDVWIDEIERAAHRWARQQRANPLAHSYKTSATYFVYVAKKWLSFAGVLRQPAIPRMRFANEFDDFAKWVMEERGLSAFSVQSHRRKISLFLKWFSERHRSFAALRLRDVDDFLIFKGRVVGVASQHVVTPARYVPSSITPSNAGGASRVSRKVSFRPGCIRMKGYPKDRNGSKYCSWSKG
jgi:hypothetical protein